MKYRGPSLDNTRRHFLRGVGVALALPWLESLPWTGASAEAASAGAQTAAAGANFALHYRALFTRSTRIFRDEELVAYAGIIFLASAAVTGLQEPVRVAFDVSGASARLAIAADIAEASSRFHARIAP